MRRATKKGRSGRRPGFDRVIFNFPDTATGGKEPSSRLAIGDNQALLRAVFIEGPAYDVSMRVLTCRKIMSRTAERHAHTRCCECKGLSEI